MREKRNSNLQQNKAAEKQNNRSAVTSSQQAKRERKSVKNGVFSEQRRVVASQEMTIRDQQGSNEDVNEIDLLCDKKGGQKTGKKEQDHDDEFDEDYDEYDQFHHMRAKTLSLPYE